MSRATGVLSPLVWKELRESGGVWLAGIATMVMLEWIPGRHGPGPSSSPVGFIVFGLVAVALGAVSVGHEYRHRTLTMLLAQPRARWRVLVVKALVLLLMLTTLVVPLWVGPGIVLGAVSFSWIVSILAAAFCFAPWFTMLARSEVAGMVFACALPSVLWLGAQGIAVAVYGLGGSVAQIEALRWSVFVPCVTVAALIGGTSGAVSFLRLQDAGGLDVGGALRRRRRLPDRVTSLGTRSRRPYWCLLKKEMRLQQLSFVVAAMFACAWMAVGVSEGFVRTAIDVVSLRQVLLTVYVVSLPLLVGSVLSAEERQMGTLAAQMLLPIAARTQWAVKLGSAFLVLVVLGLLLPLALATIWPGSVPGPGAWATINRRATFEMSVAASVAFAVTAYVSSVTTGGVKTLLMATAVLVGGVVAAPVPLLRVLEAATPSYRTLVGVPGISVLAVSPSTFHSLMRWGPLVLGGALALHLLWLAFANHRSVDTGLRSVRRQVALMVAIAFMAVMTHNIGLRVLEAARIAKQIERDTARPASEYGVSPQPHR